MSLGADTNNRALLVVIPASSEGATQTAPPAFLRPIMGRPSLDYLLDAVIALSPDDITLVVFGDGAADLLSDSAHAKGISIIAGAGDPSALINDLKEKIRGFKGDCLLVPGSLIPSDSRLLPDFIASYHEQTGTPCRATATTVDGRERTRLFVAEASRVIEPVESTGTADNRGIPFDDLVLSIFAGPAGDSGMRDFIVREPRRLWDASRPRDLAAATRIFRTAVVERLMDGGVTIIDPDRTYVDWAVAVGPGTTLYPDTYLEGATAIGSGCLVEPNVRIIDSRLSDDVTVKMCTVITESVVERGVQIGPFAHIRPKSKLCEEAKIGNFVEVKKSTIGRGSKASHLSYIGDARIGQRVNVGAGTITCNYDGVNKHTTTIEDGVFIGSDTQLVAPVVVGEYSLIGAGSTITKDVPPNALAVSRTKQVNISDRGVKSRKEHK